MSAAGKAVFSYAMAADQPHWVGMQGARGLANKLIQPRSRQQCTLNTTERSEEASKQSIVAGLIGTRPITT